jgi:PAS domain S-box-containing protein
MRNSNRKPEPREATPWEDEAAKLLSGARKDLAEQRGRVKKFEQIFNLSTEALVLINSEARIELINLAAEHLLGKEPGDSNLLQWNFLLEDGKTPHPGIKPLLARVVRGETIEEELRFDRPGMTEPPWVTVTAHPIQYKGNRTISALLRFQDISKLKHGDRSPGHFEPYHDLLLRFTHDLESASESLDEILARIAYFAATLIGDACLLGLVSSDHKTLEFHSFHHTSPEAQACLHSSLFSIRYDAGSGIIGTVLKTGKPVLIASIPENSAGLITPLDRTQYLSQFGVSSLIIVPIIVRREVIGILECFCERGGKPYTLDDQSLLQEIAERGAFAIDRARLQDSLQVHVNKLVSAQKALYVNEARFQTIFNASPAGIMLLDIDGRLLQFNARLYEMLGYSPKELSEHFLSEYVYPQTLLDFERALRNFQTGAVDPQQMSLLIKRKGETSIWTELNLGAVRNTNGEIEQVVGILSDISARKEMEAEIQEMNHRLLESLEQERLQLALELHDGPMQELHSISYQLENLRNNLTTNPQELIIEIRESVLQTIQNLRKTAKELRPPALMDFGLEKAIRSYTEDFRDKYPRFTFHLQLAPDQDMLGNNVRLALYRIYQQALMNIVRHADASEIRVRFALDAEDIELEIQDNGKGFEIPDHWLQFVRQGHYGLAGAAERVRALNGEFQIFSELEQGTRIYIRIPRAVGSSETLKRAGLMEQTGK